MVKISKQRKILLISLIVAVGMITGFSVFTQDVGIIVNVGVICMFIVVTPLFLYRYLEFLWIKSVEKEFPNFMRDLAGFKKSGITLSEAVKMATRNKYGKLTPEIQKFANRLSWGVPFLRSLEIFAKRFRSSMIISEALDILKESYLSGGKIDRTLDSISKDMMLLREIEEERKSVVRQHVMIMYGIFFMFTGVSLAIIYVLLPMMAQPQAQTMGMQSPMSLTFEDPCSGLQAAFPCSYFDVVCKAFTVPKGMGCYYVSLFFTVLLIQAIFMGLIAGQLGENSVIAGVKHSLIMLAFIFVIFMFIVRAGLLPF